MKRPAWVLIAVLLLALPVGAQDAGVLPDSFAFDYRAHLAVEGLDSFAFAAEVSGSGTVDRVARAFDISANGEIRLGDTQIVPVNAEYRWVDDQYLFRYPDDKWQAWGSASAYAAGWIGQLAFVDVDSAKIADWDLSGIEGWSALVGALTSGDPSSFLSTEQLADEGESAHFQSRVDLHALMQTDAFVNAVAAFAQTQGNNLVIYEPAELGTIVRANSALFQNASMTLDQYVGPGDNLLRRIVLTLDVPLDPTQLGYPEPPFKVSAEIDITLTDLNQAQTLDIPDSIPARPVDTERRSEPAEADAMQAVYFESGSEFAELRHSFEAQAGDVVTISVRGLRLEYDSVVELLSPSGEILAENDDHEAPAFGLGDTDSQIVDFPIEASGTYTVSVSELGGAAGSVVMSITIQR